LVLVPVEAGGGGGVVAWTVPLWLGVVVAGVVVAGVVVAPIEGVV
jgi:hypothetical protein